MTRWGWLGLAASALGWRGPVAVGLWWILGAWRRRRAPRNAAVDGDVDQLAALVLIALSASHTLAGALDAAPAEVGGFVGSEAADLLRRSRLVGLSRALAETEGALSPFTLQLARAQVTGAPMVGAIGAFLDTRRAAMRSGLMESARTLPVRLIVPVALFLLPGFVVLVMGPFVADQVADLTMPVVP